jgi:hypothetical protein
MNTVQIPAVKNDESIYDVYLLKCFVRRRRLAWKEVPIDCRWSGDQATAIIYLSGVYGKKQLTTMNTQQTQIRLTICFSS